MISFGYVQTMDLDNALHYRVRLRSLQWAADLLRELRHSPDSEAVSAVTHWALDAVYDLSEAHRVLNGDASATQERDKELVRGSSEEGPRWEKVAGLLVARGKKTHKLASLVTANPLGELPYDFADLTDWVWQRPSWHGEDRLAQRSAWFIEHVSNRPLWVPLDEAYLWFLVNSPVEVPQLGQALGRGVSVMV